MQWAVANKIIQGVDAENLAPKATATRAQMAAIIQRFQSLEKAE